MHNRSEPQSSRSLPSWTASALQQPASSTVAARAAIMDRVHREPLPKRLSAPMHASRWSRRGLLTPVGALALFMTALATLSLHRADQRESGVFANAAHVIGDTVVALRNRAAFSHGVADAWLDTMHVVEFVLHAPSVQTAVVVGDFNAWRRGASPLHLDTDGAWRTRALVSRDALRFLYVVNNARVVVPAPLPVVRNISRLSPDSI